MHLLQLMDGRVPPVEHQAQFSGTVLVPPAGGRGRTGCRHAVPETSVAACR